MDNSIHLGNGVIDEATAEINHRAKELTKTVIDVFFDFLEEKVKNLPEVIGCLRNSPEIEQRVAPLYSEYLFEEGVIPKGYKGLPDNLLIANFHQEGYSTGLYVGYILAMMALVDNNAPKDIILAARDNMYPNLIGHHYNDSAEIINRYKDEKYSWIGEG